MRNLRTEQRVQRAARRDGCLKQVMKRAGAPPRGCPATVIGAGVSLKLSCVDRTPDERGAERAASAARAGARVQSAWSIEKRMARRAKASTPRRADVGPADRIDREGTVKTRASRQHHTARTRGPNPREARH